VRLSRKRLCNTLITPNPEGVYMARWFGLGLLGIGLTTLLARDGADCRRPAPHQAEQTEIRAGRGTQPRGRAAAEMTSVLQRL
jgi:hypothetical protein